MSEVVVLTQLAKWYRNFWGRKTVHAIQGLDLAMPAGGVFGLLGPNGSGKTTTFRCCLGLTYPSAGTVRVLGGSPQDPAIRGRVGYLPEETRVFPHLGAAEALDLVGRLHGLRRTERKARVAELLDRLGLADVARRRLGGFSRGMLRRWGLAQAIIHKPELLILDEPTAGLDPLGARDFKSLIRGLTAGGTTVILSSHLLADVEDLCDRIAILDRGRLITSGSVDQILTVAAEHVLRVRGLDEAGLSALAARARELGGEVISQGHPRDTLESVFVKLVGRDGKRAP